MTKPFVVEVSDTTYRLTCLFSLGINITVKENIHEIWYYSVITEILIHLKDLTQKLKKLNNGINFTDNITPSKFYDEITSLVAYCRDAACHNDSGKRRNVKGTLFAGNVFASDIFEDDITIYMGDANIFVKRHLLRAYKEVITKFANYPEIGANHKFKEAVELARKLCIID